MKSAAHRLRIQVLLLNFKANYAGILVTSIDVVDRQQYVMFCLFFRFTDVLLPVNDVDGRYQYPGVVRFEIEEQDLDSCRSTPQTS